MNNGIIKEKILSLHIASALLLSMKLTGPAKTEEEGMSYESNKQIQPSRGLIKKIAAWPQIVGYTLYFILICTVIFIPLQGRADQQMVGLDQNNTTVELSEGQILQIELPGNVGSGLKWSLDELDDSFWRLMKSDKKIVENDSPDFVGNSYLQYWKFKALKTGNSNIRLLYNSPWESKSMAVKIFEIKVVVKP